MKSKIFGVSLGSTLFIFLLIAVLALVRPVYLRITEALSAFESSLSQKLEDETGLAFSYQSLSPSIFIGVNVKNIGIYEVSTRKKIVEIKRAELSYSIAGFFSKNPSVALKELSLNGVTVEYNSVKDSQFIENIKKLAGKNKNDNSKPEDKNNIKIDRTELDIPVDVNIKNLTIHYSNETDDVLVTLKKLKLADFNFSDGININSSGKITAKTYRIKNNGRAVSFASSFLINGIFYPDFEGSSALVSLSGSSGADYSVFKIDTLLNFTDDKLELRTMRTVLPYSLFANFDFSKKELAFSADFNRFNPLSLVSIRRKNDFIKKIDGSLLTGSLNGRFSEDDMNYRANLTVSVSQKFAGEPVSLVFKIDGDEKNVNISNISAKGNFIDCDFYGKYDIEKKQPSGTFSLGYFLLKNGGIISTEMYIDPYRNGFMCFAPQLFLNEKSFTALQFTLLPLQNSFDFQFEMFDYAHADYEEAGKLEINGSFILGRENFLQTQIAVSNIFADSLIETGAFFLEPSKSEKLKSVAQSFEPYIFTTEAYFSTDFNKISVNAPQCLFANTRKDREILIFSLDGSQETLQLSQFDLQFGNHSAHAEIEVDFADTFKEFSFTSAFTLNSIPYSFYGNFTPEWISVSGDYNFDAIVSIDERIGATLQFSQLPFAFGKNVFASSTSAILYWDENTGFEANIISFEIEEPSLNLAFNPHLAFSGTINPHGFALNSISYTDETSSLDGTGNIVWNLNEKIFDSLHANINAESPITSEKISLSADFTNPTQAPFSLDSLMNEFYMSVNASVVSFPSSRLLTLQNPDNTISAEVTATGTFVNPFVSVQIHRASLLLSGYPFVMSGNMVLDDTGFNVSDLNFSWSAINVNDISANFDLKNFSGEAKMNVNASILEKTIHAPLNLKVSGESSEKRFGLPDYYSVSLFSELVTGDFFNSDFPVNLTLLHSPGRFDLMTNAENGFKAVYTTDGSISVVTGKKSPVRFNVEGTVIQNKLDIDVSGIFADMRYICSEVEIPFVFFNSGILTGNLKITGLTTDPEYTGAFTVTQPNFLISYISQNYLHAEKVYMNVENGEAVVPPTLVTLGKGLATVEYRMEFNKWLPNALELKINIDENKKVPLDLSFPFIHAKGLASGNLDLNFAFPRDVTISGFVLADEADVEVVATSLQNQFSLDNILMSVPSPVGSSSSSINVTVDFDIIVGQKVQLLFNPFLRGVVAPGTPLSIYFDSDSGTFDFKSDITLRGGELVWLNRNFYLKEGRIVFNENQNLIDPKVTVRAETRERDDNGNMVTIILSANNQRVSTFRPLFSSNPAKSEKEIMEILGQVIAGDSEDVYSLIATSGDYFVQATAMRKIENTLRELLNFDIVSIRTSVLQNSIKLSMDEDSSNKQISLGNFIDNSTVYFGKYFGSSIYVDSLLHWSYDETRVDDRTSTSGLVFQPELGFEIASPFVNIRLGVAPDIDSLQKGLLNTFVPSTSMTLSWKFAF
ncbi:hypothetical protein [Treponema sp.]|uniref:hypothetical protein n=1 Tax=Treponema sp. TaxID=166 RepID=UPI00388E753E